jgi:hypothetical protein
MQMKLWSIRLALSASLFFGALGCHITDTFLAQATVAPTKTKTVKPTFTVVPTATQTPIPPTLAPTATTKPTLRPTPRPPTKPPPTRPPAPPPPAPSGPTVSPYSWHVNPPGCEHAGGVYVKARVYGDKNNPDSGLEGVLVVLGDGNGTRYDIPPYTTTWDGTYSFTLSADGAPPYKGTVFIWLIDSGGNRISDIGGPMVFNGLGADVPNSCWHGWVDFWR